MSHLILIGGGQWKGREHDPAALSIDRYLADLAARRAGADRRACALFLPTASHDCMPYYNTFHKVYTGTFGLKTDVALTVGREIDPEKMRRKFESADLLYVGGGDTVFMIGQWRESGLLPFIREAFDRGTPIAGLSAGAICWFEDMYSDSVVEGEFHMYRGLGWLEGKISPHYDERMLDFDRIVVYNKYRAWGVENDAALEMVDGKPVNVLSSGGKVWYLDGSSGKIAKTELVFDDRKAPPSDAPSE